jgi:hypothetical protein
VKKLYKHTAIGKSQISLKIREKAGEQYFSIRLWKKQYFHDRIVEKSNCVLDHIRTLEPDGLIRTAFAGGAAAL